jgi:MoaA/NifB/PqqE/SkfB family radical SAM enzyme
MEPTLDPRLSDFISIIGNSPARPKGTLVLQTNGLLLHRHDHKRMVEDGLTNLSVSLDVADPELQKELRGGMSLAKVIRNVEAFRVAAPTVEVEFISVVTKSNVNKMAGLVDMALSCGAHRIVFRELLYYSESEIVDHTRMRSLLLDAGEFQRMTDIITAAYSHRVELIFSPNDVLDASAREMIKNSDRKIELRPPVYHSSSLEPHVHGGG